MKTSRSQNGFFRHNRLALGEAGPSRRSRAEAGQTLIETLAAVFILVMGVTAATGMAIFAFSASTGIVKQIIATGLAREGVEAVRNMRDTNWLRDTLSVNGCYDFETAQSNAADCYLAWLGKKPPNPSTPFCLDPTNNNGASCQGTSQTQNYALTFDKTNNNFWLLARQRGANRNYGLQFDSALAGDKGFYYSTSDGSANSGIACANGASMSDYCRTIVITKINNALPYNQDVGPLLFVQSQVWWVDKKCPRAADFASARSGCRIELDSYLTNWKNY